MAGESGNDPQPEIIEIPNLDEVPMIRGVGVIPSLLSLLPGYKNVGGLELSSAQAEELAHRIVELDRLEIEGEI